jgi:hypothetical protein
MTTAINTKLAISAALSFMMVYQVQGNCTGTPLVNTDPPWYEPAATNTPTLNIPKGSTNLAAGKPVTSSDMEPIIGELKYITDGNKDLQDITSCVELFGKHHVQIDLLTNATIYAIWVWHNNSKMSAHLMPNVDVPNDVVIQLGYEPTFTNNTTTVFNADSDNSLGLGKGKDMPFGIFQYGKVIHIPPTPARFIRVYGRGGKLDETTKYVEIEVYGKPISDTEKKGGK